MMSLGQIYLLGISHVSSECARKAADLVRSVDPEYVMIELCEERTRLLVDDEEQASLWWVASEMPCRLLGLPKDIGWPSEVGRLRFGSVRYGTARHDRSHNQKFEVLIRSRRICERC